MTSTPHPATREYRRQIIRIADLVVTESTIQDVRFENCTLIGPAVLAGLQDVVMSGCVFEAPFDVLFWIVPDSRTAVAGAVGLVRVEFYSCRFQDIGLTVSESNLAGTRREFGLE